MDAAEEDRLKTKLLAVHYRVQWMSNKEERAAWFKGFAAQGVHTREDMKLIEETDEMLNRLYEQR